MKAGNLLKVSYGCNAPQLIQEINEELIKEIQVLEGKRERVALPFDQMTPEEKKKQAEIEAKKAIEIAKERAELEARQDRVKRRYLERLARKFYNFSLVVFFPNAVKLPEGPDAAPRKTSPAAYKLMSLYDTVGLAIVDQLEMQLTRDEISELFYNSGYYLPPKVYDLMLKEEVIVSFVQMIKPLKIPPPTEVISPTTSRVSIISHTSAVLDKIEDNLSLIVYGPDKKPTTASKDSVYKMFETRDKDTGEILPPCWTPREHISKCAAARVIFPAKIAALNVKEIEVPPPSFIMVFEGERAYQVLDTAKAFASEVIHVGYFDSSVPEAARKICNTIYELEEMPDDILEMSKVVVALSKERSEPTLIMTQLGPVYVSPDMKTAEREVDQFFPPTVEEEEEPDPWGPPPPMTPRAWFDESNNEYLEDFMPDLFGNIRRARKLIKLADGTEVEDGEELEITEAEMKEIIAKEKIEYEELRIKRRKDRERRKRDAFLKGKMEDEEEEEVVEEEVVEEEEAGVEEEEDDDVKPTEDEIRRYQELEREILEYAFKKQREKEEEEARLKQMMAEAAGVVVEEGPLFTQAQYEAFEKDLYGRYEYLNFMNVMPGLDEIKK